MNEQLKTFIDNLVLDETNNHLGEIEENFLLSESFSQAPTSLSELEQKYHALIDEIDEPWWMIWTMVCDMLPELCSEDEIDNSEAQARQYIETEYHKRILKGLARHFGQ